MGPAQKELMVRDVCFGLIAEHEKILAGEKFV
jgi:hypothetical protein